jgi:coenzyme F420-reducing hydrogenase delta subunit
MQPDRVRMVNLSAAMAGAFVEAVTEMAERIESLGPNPLRLARPADASLSRMEGEA